MSVLFSNSASTTLSAGVGDSATSITVADGSVFPAITGSDYFYLTLEVDSDPELKEIVKCTARSGNTLTIVRGQDNTSARTFSTADKAQLRLTAAGLNDVATQADTDTTYSVQDGELSENNFTNADHTKLDGIAASANNHSHPSAHAISFITGLQSALDGKVDDSQVLTNVPSGALFTDTNTTYSVQDGELSQNNFTNADHTKLDGIEAGADATDTTNVTAAGALMDSELTSIASVKALNQGVSTTDSPAFTGLELNGTEAIQLPSGTTAQRPTAAAGKLRFNSTTGGFEGYTSEWASLGGIGDEYISATPTLSSSANNQITVSNHSSYASPIYIVKIGNAVIQHTIASNVITLVGVTLSEQTISVTVTASETGLGKLFSNATVSMVVTDAAPTPALSITGLTNRKIQVTNHASYGSGIVYTAKIGSTVVSHTMDSDTIILADNTSFASDQTVAITASVNGGTSSAVANATVDMGGASYQYYRLINILAVQGSTGVALSEIALSDGFTANYNSFTTGSTNITASYSHSSYPVSNATGATVGYWWSVHGHNNTSTWVKFSFSQATVAKAIRLRAASSTYIATTFKFQGSNDDANWTDIGTFGAPQYNNHTVTHDINKD